jgi:hypothetical protein
VHATHQFMHFLCFEFRIQQCHDNNVLILMFLSILQVVPHLVEIISLKKVLTDPAAQVTLPSRNLRMVQLKSLLTRPSLSSCSRPAPPGHSARSPSGPHPSPLSTSPRRWPTPMSRSYASRSVSLPRYVHPAAFPVTPHAYVAVVTVCAEDASLVS